MAGCRMGFQNDLELFLGIWKGFRRILEGFPVCNLNSPYFTPIFQWSPVHVGSPVRGPTGPGPPPANEEPPPVPQFPPGTLLPAALSSAARWRPPSGLWAIPHSGLPGQWETCGLGVQRVWPGLFWGRKLQLESLIY